MAPNVIEAEIKGRKFKIGKTEVMKQFHVARRISPILTDALPAMKKMKELQENGGFDELDENRKLDAIAGVITPFVHGMAKLGDADAELVLFSLLGCCEVYQTEFKTWARVANEKMLMMQDLDLPTLLQVAGRSFMHNLAGFF